MRLSVEENKKRRALWSRFLVNKFQQFRMEKGDWRASQGDFAREKLGVEDALLSSWIRENRLPSDYYVRHLAAPERLGPEVYEIFPEAAPFGDDALLRRLVEIYQQLPEEARQQALVEVERVAKKNKVEVSV